MELHTDGLPVLNKLSGHRSKEVICADSLCLVSCHSSHSQRGWLLFKINQLLISPAVETTLCGSVSFNSKSSYSLALLLSYVLGLYGKPHWKSSKFTLAVLFRTLEERSSWHLCVGQSADYFYLLLWCPVKQLWPHALALGILLQYDTMEPAQCKQHLMLLFGNSNIFSIIQTFSGKGRHQRVNIHTNVIVFNCLLQFTCAF